MSRFLVPSAFGIAVLAIVIAAIAWGVRRDSDPAATHLGLAAVMRGAADVNAAPSADADRPAFPVFIRPPAGAPAVDVLTGVGQTLSISCSVCHSIREPDRATRTPADLDEFHQNMSYAHGDLACFACHDPDSYDELRLADGTSIAFAKVMTLCAQCHGPQARDYAHGAHGGMSGYWDVTRGPRVRNTCTDCHDPHVPAFPTMVPTFKPRDRFLVPPREHAGADR